MAGMRLGPYEVVRHLGAGGMSTVWLARGPLPSGEHGLVVLKRQIQPEEDANLREEARVGMRLQHPGVVRTWGTFDDDDKRPILVLEYVPGASLAQLRKRGPLPAAAVCRIGADIAEALTALHDARDERGAALRILHRDVTPANIIVSHDGVARLIDLGIARSTESSVEKTQTGSVKGTLRYVAPELFEGNPHTPSTDLWALGVCLFEAALGRPAVTGPEATVLAAVVRGQLLTLRPSESVDPHLLEVIQRLCTTDVDKRFPHARIAARRLAAGDASSQGAMLASIAVYAAVDEPRTDPSVHGGARTVSPGSTGSTTGSTGSAPGPAAGPLGPASAAGDDGFAKMAASTYCGQDDDPFAEASQASTLHVEQGLTVPLSRAVPAPVTAIAASPPDRVPHTPAGKPAVPDMAATMPLGVPAPTRERERERNVNRNVDARADGGALTVPMGVPAPPLDERELAMPPTTPGTPGGERIGAGDHGGERAVGAAGAVGPARADAWDIPQPITGEDGATEPQPVSPRPAPPLPITSGPTTEPTDEMHSPVTDSPSRVAVDEPSRGLELVDLREQALGAPSVIAFVVVVVAIALGVLFALSR